MKRANHLFEKIISDENIDLCITEVCRTHRWLHGHRPNKTTLWVESTREERKAELREIITKGFQPAPPKMRKIYDRSAQKEREICEPKLWPDQFVHHAVIQVLEPILMKNMYHWCCGSIRGRGVHYGAYAIKKWMKRDTKGTKFFLELDVKQFYKSIKPKHVMGALRRRIKDGRALSLIETMIGDGIMIGYYFSQWFANMLLQDIDKAIMESGLCRHHVRYVDNFTVCGSNKRKMRKLMDLICRMLRDLDLELKENWQLFRFTVRRLPNALGFRFGRGYTLLRKRTLLRLTRTLHGLYHLLDAGRRLPYRLVHGMMARLGQLKHCNSRELRERIIRQNFVKMLRNIIRRNSKKEVLQWNTALQHYVAARRSSTQTVLA